MEPSYVPVPHAPAVAVLPLPPRIAGATAAGSMLALDVSIPSAELASRMRDRLANLAQPVPPDVCHRPILRDSSRSSSTVSRRPTK